MESLDLNIDNYNLPDILALFGLPTLFNEDDLKRAKLAVLKTHPDKSQLPKEYFLFFTKAYRIVHQIYTIRHPAINEHYTTHVERTPRSSAVPSVRCIAKDTPYTPIDGGMAATAATAAAKSVVDYGRLMRSEGYRGDADDEYSKGTHERMKRRLDEMMGGTGTGGGCAGEPAKVKEFNQWFNQKFEQYRLKDDEVETGYDAWFRDTGDTDAATAESAAEDDSGSWADKVARLNQKKQELRNKYALVERTELEYAGGGGGSGSGSGSGSSAGGYDLTRERPQEYSSGIFGNLRYEDLKKAHTETVIPVTEEDYYNTRRFNTINELQTFRDQSRRDSYKQTSKAEQEHIYQQSKMRQEEEDTRRAFILAKQDEISRDIHKKLYSDIFRLE
jgi:hypothetical protein